MSENKLLTVISDFFDEKKKKQKKHKSDLIKVLKKLDQYLIELNQRLDSETREKRIQRINKEIEIVEAKIKKGNKLLKKIED